MLQAEISEKQAHSIKYQLTVARLPLAKDIDDFDFTGTPVNESLIRDLAGGVFVADPRNVVLVGGTGTGKSHPAIAIAWALIRNCARGGSSMSSTWSTDLRPRPAPAGRAVPPTT